MMPSPITRSDRPLTNGERLAAWCEAARRRSMHVDFFQFNTSSHRLPRRLLNMCGNEKYEMPSKRGMGQK